jgi:hypothetical protein
VLIGFVEGTILAVRPRSISWCYLSNLLTPLVAPEYKSEVACFILRCYVILRLSHMDIPLTRRRVFKLRRVRVEKSAQTLVEKEIHARLFPKPGDPLYLHLADLLLAVRKAATSESITVLDYGAGLAPYRSSLS